MQGNEFLTKMVQCGGKYLLNIRFGGKATPYESAPQKDAIGQRPMFWKKTGLVSADDVSALDRPSPLPTGLCARPERSLDEPAEVC
jgi:hypothetical protein